MSSDPTRIGATVDQADPVAEAELRGTIVVQIALGDLQSHRGPEIAYPGGAAALRAAAEAASVDIYVHAPYIINVASTNNRVRIPSRKLLAKHLSAAAEIGAKGLVVHGGHLGKDEDPAVGFDNWRKAVDQADLVVPLLIENTAGGTNAVARHADRIGRLWEALSAADGFENVGLCLDTCHAWAGGIPLATAAETLRGITGRIDLIHGNDSRDDFGSGADRHANLGQGRIDPDELVGVIAAAGAPVVLETPGGAEEHRADIAWLRERLDAAH